MEAVGGDIELTNNLIWFRFLLSSKQTKNMLSVAPLHSIEAEESNDFGTAVDFVRSVALGYKENPLAEPTESALLSSGTTLRAAFIDSYWHKAGTCFMADGELPIEGEVRQMLSNGRREIYLNAPDSKQMVKIWLEPAPEKSAVRATRDRVAELR